MPLETHDCPIPGCGKACPMHHLMCVAHWRMVPKPLREEVLRAWRLRRRIGLLQAIGEHIVAKDKAIAAVVEKLTRKGTQEHQAGLFPS